MGRFKVGDRVRVIGQTWPTHCIVIGHKEGHPIIQPEPCCYSDESVETLSDWSRRIGISDAADIIG